ncbi:glycosyltransferase family A protein [Croceicoccus hydrothermalis]|uniref:glycosyltransferase family 2 protein n=1 Tax=Croceicoccus hydrothermalis TaxID=2867964 RepID=UPI001EFB9F58|nr:glycosyltransferase family A protein [Croceicoccus hydrothermalis]
MTERSQAPVAAILTCYNEGPYIGEAVRSILDQSRADLIREIVIADDGSHDDTLATLREIERWDDRIRVLYGSGGAGLPGQRCWAISETSSPYIAILDGDDIWVKRKLELQVPILDERPEVGMVYGRFFTFPDFDKDRALLANTIDISKAGDLPVTYFLNDPPIIPSTTLIRRDCYDASGGFDPQVKVFEDTDFFLRIIAVARLGFVDEPLLYKRNRNTSITGGRKDLMAHHAFVALRAAANEPELLPLVPRRLAERARKLGNHRFLLNDREGALLWLRFAVRLHPFNRRSWMSLVAVSVAPGLALRMLGRAGRERQSALGVN